ncbi:MAG: ABC transporter permease subunit [Oscillospiraceae bacterium]|nr:ABC transporter permease subunit [Oscillospiraceae bacterium]
MMKKQKSIRLNAGTFTSVLYPVLFGVLIFVLWQTQVLNMLLHTDTFTLPLPTRIAAIIADNIPAIMTNVRATAIEAVFGLLFGSLLGYGIAMIATFFPKGGKGGLSIVSVFNAVPIVAMAPVMNNWTKSISSDASVRSMVSKILVITLICMATMSLNAFRGLNELKPFSHDLMDTYAAGRKEIFLKLQLPNSLPFIFTALRVTVPMSIISAVVCEYFAEYIIGVGRMIRENIVLAQYSTAWAYIVIACLMGIVMYGILMIAECILLRHRRTSR